MVFNRKKRIARFFALTTKLGTGSRHYIFHRASRWFGVVDRSNFNALTPQSVVDIAKAYPLY